LSEDFGYSLVIHHMQHIIATLTLSLKCSVAAAPATSATRLSCTGTPHQPFAPHFLHEPPFLGMATTIRIDDTIRPTRSHESAAANGGIGGVYHLRNVSKSSLDRRSTGIRGRRGSVDRRSLRSGDNEAAEDEDAGLRQSGDFKKRQVFTGKTLLWLAYQSIGVIYGDIGTSPLYVYSSTFTSEPSYDDLVGVLSIIIWSLTMMVTVKYVLIILHADNEGEGGTFSCYSLISRYVSVS
jgi:KUP system potassium uptake protein